MHYQRKHARKQKLIDWSTPKSVQEMQKANTPRVGAARHRKPKRYCKKLQGTHALVLTAMHTRYQEWRCTACGHKEIRIP